MRRIEERALRRILGVEWHIAVILICLRMWIMPLTVHRGSVFGPWRRSLFYTDAAAFKRWSCAEREKKKASLA